MIDLIRKVTPSFVKKRIRELLSSNQDCDPYSYLKTHPRYRVEIIEFLGRRMKIIDSASFLSMNREIFCREIYKFHSESPNIYIIDGGANIGMATIYFKLLYPDAEIIAFEPDERAFGALQYNVHEFQLRNITLVQKALWDQNTTLEFFSEGADGNRISVGGEGNLQKVDTVRLDTFLNKKVDFLKLDIEGAETTVMDDCADLLGNVDNLFVEYHSFSNKDQELDKILKILNRNGFRYYIINNNDQSIHPFLGKDVRLGMDNLLNIVATRK